jgi:hypothetical protein
MECGFWKPAVRTLLIALCEVVRLRAGPVGYQCPGKLHLPFRDPVELPVWAVLGVDIVPVRPRGHAEPACA